MKLVANEWMMQSVQLTKIATRAIRSQSHVIVCGYGRSGQQLARLLGQEEIPYMALDLDPDRVRQAAAAGQSVVFGDAAKVQSLMAAGLARASAVVVSYHDTPSALKILHLVHEHAPTVPVLVRTIDDADMDTLKAAGATEVVPEAIEGSLMLAAQALALRILREGGESDESRAIHGFRLCTGRTPTSAEVKDLLADPTALPGAGTAAADTVRGMVQQLSELDSARSPLWTARSLHRRVDVLRVGFEPTRAAAKRLGGTLNTAVDLANPVWLNRSEKRRVGKECRSRWSPYH